MRQIQNRRQRKKKTENEKHNQNWQHEKGDELKWDKLKIENRQKTESDEKFEGTTKTDKMRNEEN